MDLLLRETIGEPLTTSPNWWVSSMSSQYSRCREWWWFPHTPQEPPTKQLGCSAHRVAISLSSYEWVVDRRITASSSSCDSTAGMDSWLKCTQFCRAPSVEDSLCTLWALRNLQRESGSLSMKIACSFEGKNPWKQRSDLRTRLVSADCQLYSHLRFSLLEQRGLHLHASSREVRQNILRMKIIKIQPRLPLQHSTRSVTLRWLQCEMRATAACALSPLWWSNRLSCCHAAGWDFHELLLLVLVVWAAPTVSSAGRTDFQEATSCEE